MRLRQEDRVDGLVDEPLGGFGKPALLVGDAALLQLLKFALPASEFTASNVTSAVPAMNSRICDSGTRFASFISLIVLG